MPAYGWVRHFESTRRGNVALRYGGSSAPPPTYSAQSAISSRRCAASTSSLLTCARASSQNLAGHVGLLCGPVPKAGPETVPHGADAEFAQDLGQRAVAQQAAGRRKDRGAPMTSKCTAQLLADLGVTRSLTRPQVSDDNPFSEAQFKTLKYHPGFPGRLHDITAAIAFCRTFFPWYNTEHRHGGIAMLTPDDIHHHRTRSVLDQRGRTLQAGTRHPERFVRGIPKPDPLPEAVWINPPVTSTTGGTAQ